MSYRFDTLAIHAGEGDEPTGAVTVPIYQTSTYVQEALGKNKGYEYARTQNPTRHALEENMAVLEGGAGARAFASGMAAATSIATFVKGGEHIVCSNMTYGGTYRYYTKIQARYGVEHTFVDTANPDEVRAACGDGSQWNLRLTYIPQDAPLGLAHAVKVAQPYLRDEPFVMYLGDNLLPSGITALVQEFAERKPDAMILLTKVPDPQRFGVAMLNPDGQVQTLVEKPAEPRSDLALVGVYLFTARIFDAVNAISPTFVDTPQVASLLADPVFKGNLVSRIPLSRVGQTDDLVGAVLLFCSDASSFITGQILTIDGSLTATQ